MTYLLHPGNVSVVAGIGELVAAPWVLREENERMKSDMLCKICAEAERCILFQPCGHLTCCEGCVSMMTKCPVCQAKINETVRVFMV